MTMPQHSSVENDLLARARKVLPQGSLGNVHLPDEYDFVVSRGLGSKIWDSSGNEYIDYLLGSGPMILGHAHPSVNKASMDALKEGTTFFTQNRYAIELAEEIVKAVPCAEQVRFTTSGSEATFQALRIARAKSGKDKVLKFEGGYHGINDYASISVTPDNPLPFPVPKKSIAGIPQAVVDTVLIAPFNDIETTVSVIEEHAKDLAAVIVEPVQRLLEPRDGFLHALSDACKRNGVILIFDEVVTGFRLAYGGAQEFYGVTPDLATLGKVVGGGMPLAAVAGSAELMSVYDSTIASSEEYVHQGGTLNGNPLACAAGLASLKELNKPSVYETYHSRGRKLKQGLQRILDASGVSGFVSGSDVFFDIFFTDQPIFDYRSTLSSDKRLNGVFDRALMHHGVFKNAGKVYVGTCHTENDVNVTLEAFTHAISAVENALG